VMRAKMHPLRPDDARQKLHKGRSNTCRVRWVS
jgi:hypothetical protein